MKPREKRQNQYEKQVEPTVDRQRGRSARTDAKENHRREMHVYQAHPEAQA